MNSAMVDRGNLGGIAAPYYPGTTIYATSIQDAVTQITNSLAPGETICSIQFWGHGSPGSMVCGDNWIQPSDFENGKPLGQLKPYLKPSSTIYLRGCSTFSGAAGQNLATSACSFFGCTVAGHTAGIGGLSYPGYQTLKPGQEPSWPVEDCDCGKGTKPKPKGKDPKQK
jgi:hypothetical protein